MSEIQDQKIVGGVDVESPITIEKVDTTLTLGQLPIDAAVDKRITRKFDRRIIPWLFGIW